MVGLRPAVTPWSSGSDWFWRWGVPLTAGVGALAAAGLAAASLWGTEIGGQRWTTAELRGSAMTAAAFATALLACWWTIAGGHRPGRPLSARDDRYSRLLAIGATATCTAVAGYYLDLGFRVDESITIASYATQPLAVAVSKYDAPNNHVLHTLLVWVAHQLGGWNRVVLRLPAFLSFCLLLPALWWFVRREYGATAAAFATLFAGTSPFFVSYATTARGYTLLLLFFTVALLCGQRLVEAPKRTAVWATWATATALGLYTLPLMAYPAAATGAWMLLARWRRCGRRQLGPFLARTAAWSAAALALAFALYLPVFAAEGVAGPYDAIAHWWQSTAVPPMELIAHPQRVWNHWHAPFPAWARGALLALVVVGGSARGRSCGGKGTLLLATGLAWGLLFAAHPLLLPPRLAIWALLVCLILAGAGAAVVFEAAMAQAMARWPDIATVARRRVLECASVALLVGVFSWWTSRPGFMTEESELVMGLPNFPLPGLQPLAVSVVGEMAPGDYFTSCRTTVRSRAALYVHEAQHSVEYDVGKYLAEGASEHEWPVHRVSAPGDGPDRASGAIAGDDHSRGHLVLLELLPRIGRRCHQARSARDFLATGWPDHEVVAAFDDGRAYSLNDWALMP